ncbi:MAG: acyl-CoA thioesterase [Cyclobacteriaceae bacterium]|nr:acyl-CoA thioesterase [Cyclobacteriaceae bacterium]
MAKLNAQEKKTFQHQFKVQQADIDELGHVNNVVYLRWVQDLAEAHWKNRAPSAVQKKYFWVVLRHEIDYLHPAFPGDAISGLTWVEDFQGARSNRIVQLYLQHTGQILAEAKTTWCLLEAATMKPKRIDEDVVSVFG